MRLEGNVVSRNVDRYSLHDTNRLPMSDPFPRFIASLAVVVRPITAIQTYKNLAYLVVGFPLALFYWVILGMGLTFGVVLSVVLLGLVILFVTILSARFFSRFERWLANRLLTVDISPSNDVPSRAGRMSSVRRYLDAPSTWRGLGFLSLKFWVGIVGFLLAYVVYQGLSMITTIIRRPVEITFGEVNGEPVVWTVNSLVDVAIAVPAGIVVVLVAIHLTNGFAYVAGRMSEAMLGSPNP